MRLSYRLLFGPLAAIIFAFGIAALALMIPGYSHVRQTVSEIGEIGSPARVPFAILLFCVATCILVFASAVRDVSIRDGRSALTAYVISFMGISVGGVGFFAYPHPLHNVFGISELIGYQAPLFVAFTWRRDLRQQTLVAFSWIMLVCIWAAILLNLTALSRHGVIWDYVKPVYGLAQRALFSAWFAWCAGAGVLLFVRESRT